MMMKAEILPEYFFKRLVLIHKLKTGKGTSGISECWSTRTIN